MRALCAFLSRDCPSPESDEYSRTRSSSALILARGEPLFDLSPEAGLCPLFTSDLSPLVSLAGNPMFDVTGWRRGNSRFDPFMQIGSRCLFRRWLALFVDGEEMTVAVMFVGDVVLF